MAEGVSPSLGRDGAFLSRGCWRNGDGIATLAHWLSLVLAVAFLLWVDRHQWFSVDSWYFLVDRGLVARGTHAGLFEPHNGHWSTIPILGYRLLFVLFGVRTYLPYLVPLLAMHLLIVHLLWRLLLRVGVEAWLATVAAALFAILGVGWENLTFVFQWQFFGPLAPGLLALLLTPEEGALNRTDVLVAGLLLLGLLFSGIGLVMVIVVAVAVALRRGLRTAAAIVSAPVAVYAVWYAAYGHAAAGPGLFRSKPTSFAAALRAVPAFVWRGLVAAVQGAIGLEGIAPAVLILLLIWCVRCARPSKEPWPLVLSTAVGAVVFLALTAIQRSGFGIAFGGASRYTYVVVALLLPGAALGVNALIRRAEVHWIALSLGGLLLLVVQLSALNGAANSNAQNDQEQKHRIMGAAVLAREHARVISPIVVPIFAPALRFEDIVRLEHDGALPGNVKVTSADVLTAREYLQVVLNPAARVAQSSSAALVAVQGGQAQRTSNDGCADVVSESETPTVTLQIGDNAAPTIRSGYSGILSLRLTEGSDSGRARSFPLVGGKRQTLSVSAKDLGVRLTLPGSGDTLICGLRPDRSASAP